LSQTHTKPINILILGDSPQATDVIATLLQGQPGFLLSVSRVAYGEATRSAKEVEPDVILLLADALEASDPIVAIEEITDTVPGASIIVLTNDTHHTMRDFQNAGARDCLVPPYEREAIAASVQQAFALERKQRDRIARMLGLGPLKHRCRVVAIHGAKGGVGATTISVNLAVALQKLTGERVALVDCSLQTGDVGVSLNIVGGAGIDDLVPNLNELDADLFDRVLSNHSSGIKVLLAPRDVERSDSIGADEMRRIVTVLSQLFDYIIVDTPATLDGAAISILDYCDHVVLVTTPDVTSLKNAGRFLQLSRRLGYPADKVMLAVNRAGITQSVPLAEVERNLGRKPVAVIPMALAAFMKAANRGETLTATRSWRGPSRSLYRLAESLALNTKTKTQPGKSLFGRRTGEAQPAPAQ
jgi:pilus assembly protein CpaE